MKQINTIRNIIKKQPVFKVNRFYLLKAYYLTYGWGLTKKRNGLRRIFSIGEHLSSLSLINWFNIVIHSVKIHKKVINFSQKKKQHFFNLTFLLKYSFRHFFINWIQRWEIFVKRRKSTTSSCTLDIIFRQFPTFLKESLAVIHEGLDLQSISFTKINRLNISQILLEMLKSVKKPRLINLQHIWCF